MKNQEENFQRLKNGDESAFREIYNAFFPKLYYFALEYVKQKDIAENIVHDTMYTFWSKKDTLTEHTNLSAYLFSVTKNNCMYRLREMRYHRKLYDNSDIEDIQYKISIDALEMLDTSTLSHDELEKAIKDTLKNLPEQCRKVFILSRFEDKKNKEIAEMLKISVKAVESHITKALKIFRINLKDYLLIILLVLSNKFWV